MRRVLGIFPLFGLTATVVIGGAKIQTQKNPQFDFSRLKTWAWDPSGPGDVKVWVTAESNPSR